MSILSILKHEYAQLRKCWDENHRPRADNGAPDIQWLHNEATSMFHSNAIANSVLDGEAEKGMNLARMANYAQRSQVRYRIDTSIPRDRVELDGQKTLKFPVGKGKGKGHEK